MLHIQAPYLAYISLIVSLWYDVSHCFYANNTLKNQGKNPSNLSDLKANPELTKTSELKRSSATLKRIIGTLVLERTLGPWAQQEDSHTGPQYIGLKRRKN
jgi:hypothetical protein